MNKTKMKTKKKKMPRTSWELFKLTYKLLDHIGDYAPGNNLELTCQIFRSHALGCISRNNKKDLLRAMGMLIGNFTKKSKMSMSEALKEIIVVLLLALANEKKEHARFLKPQELKKICEEIESEMMKKVSYDKKSYRSVMAELPSFRKKMAEDAKKKSSKKKPKK